MGLAIPYLILLRFSENASSIRSLLLIFRWLDTLLIRGARPMILRRSRPLNFHKLALYFLSSTETMRMNCLLSLYITSKKTMFLLVSRDLYLLAIPVLNSAFDRSRPRILVSNVPIKCELIPIFIENVERIHMNLQDITWCQGLS